MWDNGSDSAFLLCLVILTTSSGISILISCTYRWNNNISRQVRLQREWLKGMCTSINTCWVYREPGTLHLQWGRKKEKKHLHKTGLQCNVHHCQANSRQALENNHKTHSSCLSSRVNKWELSLVEKGKEFSVSEHMMDIILINVCRRTFCWLLLGC